MQLLLLSTTYQCNQSKIRKERTRITDRTTQKKIDEKDSELAHKLSLLFGVDEHSKALSEYIETINPPEYTYEKRVKKQREERKKVINTGELVEDLLFEILDYEKPQTAETISGKIIKRKAGISSTPSSTFIKLRKLEKEQLVKQVQMTFNRVGWVKV